VILAMPVIALILTTLFEGYRWTPAALVGVGLVLVGNYLALRR
jgi:drug/metabolite transporter (DMT)-like permease